MENALYDFHSLIDTIRKLTRSLRSLVRFLILHNLWIKIIRAHFPWSNLYLFFIWPILKQSLSRSYSRWRNHSWLHCQEVYWKTQTELGKIVFSIKAFISLYSHWCRLWWWCQSQFTNIWVCGVIEAWEMSARQGQGIAYEVCKPGWRYI